MNYLSSCLIVKDENEYIEEIILYNILQGVEHQYIYDNDSKIPINISLKRFIDKKLITVINYPGRAKQMPAYLHCLINFGHKTKWLFIHDADEFICPTNNKFNEFLTKYENFAGVGINWIMFGSSGHKNKPKGYVIENYFKHLPKDNKANNHIKTVCQPDKVIKTKMFDPHHVLYKPNNFCVSEGYKKISGPFSPHSSDMIQLNHYWTKSEQEFILKMSRGTADGTPNRKIEDFINFNNDCLLFEDRKILKYLDELKNINI